MATASERAAELNVATRAWIAAEPERGAGLLSEDDAYWAECGIHSGEELDAYLAYSDYADLSKEAYGWKDRRDWRTLDAAGWDAETAHIQEGIDAAARAEEAHKVWARDITSGAPMTFSPFAGLRL